jgi:hypothetical protein
MPEGKAMNGKEPNDAGRKSGYRVHLPGFVADEDIGLGDVVKRVTYKLGIKHCRGCERRAETLNRWVKFMGGS